MFYIVSIVFAIGYEIYSLVERALINLIGYET